MLPDKAQDLDHATPAICVPVAHLCGRQYAIVVEDAVGDAVASGAGTLLCQCHPDVSGPGADRWGGFAFK